jgi:hypothetical protein
MLLAFYGLVLSLILVMHLAPDSPLGRAALRQLVERPLAWFAGLTRQKVMAGLLVGIVFFGGAEVVVVMGPELMAAYLVDLALYLDVVVLTGALASLARMRDRLRAIGAGLLGRLRAVSGASRGNRQVARPRARRALRRRTSASDNDDNEAAAAADRRLVA